MPGGKLFHRRNVLHTGLALGGLAASGAIRQAVAGLTPSQSLGPFYPVVKPRDQDADLTRIAGGNGRAQGRILHVTGRVLGRDGRPVRGARLEIWQANAHGRYTHPLDASAAPLDPNFEGFAVIETDDRGRYRFTTIKPGAYTVTADWARPPHIHFDVTGHTGRVVTQMYFPDEPLNAKDRLLLAADDRQALIARYQDPSGDMEAGALAAAWDIVLPEV